MRYSIVMEDEMKLVQPTKEMSQALVQMIDDYKSIDSQLDRPYFKDHFDFNDYIDEISVSSTIHWWLMTENEIIGTARLRLFLEGSEEEDEHGHIGYDISPKFRKQGYGYELLKYMLKKAEERNFKKVLLTCTADHVASQKIIMFHGGELDKIIWGEDGWIKRYWIQLK